MIKKVFLVFSVLSFSLPSLLKAQDTTLSLTLQSAIDLGIKNSKQLKSGKAKIDEALAVLHQAKDQQLPDFKISGAYLRVTNPDISLNIKSSNSGGGNGGSTNNIKVSQAVYGISSISLPLYSGLRIQYGIESAKYLEQAARLDVDHDRESVILNTVNAYINLYKAKAAVTLVKENLEQSRQRDADFTNLEKNGLLARNDLLKAELQTSNIELSLADAESNWKLANLNMDLLLGLPEKADILLDSTSLLSPTQVQSVTDYENQAIQNRNDLKALSARQKAADVGIKAAKGEYYPGIALTGGYVAADIPGFLSITNAVNIGIGLQYNLSSLWKTNSKVAQAKAREQQILANEDLLNDNVRFEVNQAYQAYLVSQKKIDVYQKAIEQANENYKITKNKYDNALATTTDLLDADVAQLQARLNYTFAKADAVAAYNKLMQVAGLLNK